MVNEIINNTIKEYEKKCIQNKQIVTVFLRTHERPQYVKIMIESILRQTYSNFCLIVIDNESKDETVKVIKTFTDQRIFLLEWKKEYGLILPNIFSMVKTKYVVCFHDDDIVDENYLETFINILENHDDYSCLACVCNLIDSEGKTIEEAKTFEGEFLFKDDDFLNKYYIESNHAIWVPYPAVMYRASFFKDFRNFYNLEAGPAGDQLVWMQTGRYGGIVAISGTRQFQYRVHNKQISQNRSMMHLQLFNYLFNDNYYKDRLIKKANKLGWIIKSQIRAALNEYERRRITKKEMMTFYYSLPKELHKPFKNKILFLAFRFIIIFPKLSLLLLKRKMHSNKFANR